ncbi:MAG: hypothetical protein AB1523_13375 [Bacillota bacterium]
MKRIVKISRWDLNGEAIAPANDICGTPVTAPGEAMVTGRRRETSGTQKVTGKY